MPALAVATVADLAADDRRLLEAQLAEERGKWTARRRMAMRDNLAFWFLGLINNSSYVIMMAFAKDILPSAVGVVFLADVAPTMVIKVSAPYWFDRVPYRTRVLASAVLMVLSFTTVGYGTKTWIQLMGVAFSSLQGGLGEASCLALASLYDTPRALTAWSSGTGFAGIFGYAWVFFFRFILGLSLRSTLQMAHFLAAGWLLTYFVLLGDPHNHGTGVGVTNGGNSHPDYSPLRSPSPVSSSQTRGDETRSADRMVNGGRGLDRRQPYRNNDKDDDRMATSTTSDQPSLDVQQGDVERNSHSSVAMTTRERLHFTLGLWPYMVPLTLVYFAEYTMQTGTWSAIGFPVTSPDARKRFYEYANWSYQGGVFVSRSSGMLVRLSTPTLWILPAVQLFMLLFFYLVAVEHFWYSNDLLLLCFGVGLVGGLGYVNAFRLVSEAVRPEMKELALASASVGDSFGVMSSDIAGAFLQKYLYRRNRISD